MMIPLVDSKYLRSSGYSITMPFRIQLASEDAPAELVCTRAARILPGKRLVCFGELNGQQVVAKFFLDARSAHRHFTRELKGVKAFQDARILTPDLLYEGRKSPEGLRVLCFQRIAPAEDLYEAFEKQPDDALRIQLLNRVIAVVAAQHEAGLRQNDLHRENFLVSKEVVYSIDGDAVDVRDMGTPLSRNKSLKNLAMFFTHLYPHQAYLISDIFKVYTEKRGWEPTKTLYNHLMNEIRRKMYQRRNGYLKKIYRECTDFVCERTWDRFMVCARKDYTAEMAAVLNDPDGYMDSGELLKAGNTATLARVTVNSREVVIKRYNIKNRLHAIRRFFRPSRAWVSWRNAHLLTYMNIPTPAPIAFVERRWGPFRRSAYFLAAYTHGTPLNHVLDNAVVQKEAAEIIRQRVLDLFRMMSDTMIGHGDFKASNFIVAGNTIQIVDLDVMKKYKSSWKFRRAFNRDLKRFMKNWEYVPEIAHQFKQMLLQLNR